MKNRGPAALSLPLLLLMASAPNAAEVAGYEIFRHESDQKCSASKFFRTADGRKANITYFQFDDGRTDEVYFGLRPVAVFDPANLLPENLTVKVDGREILSRPVSIDPSGMFVVPVENDREARRFIASLDTGDELDLSLRSAEQTLALDLGDLRAAKAALTKCLEAKNANP